MKTTLMTEQNLVNATVFENHRKSRIQHCEQGELLLHFALTKVHQKCQKSSIWRAFDKLLSTQNVNVARNVECDFFCDFQTLCNNKKKKNFI